MARREIYNTIDCKERLMLIGIGKDKYGGYKQDLLEKDLGEMEIDFYVCVKCIGLMRSACLANEPDQILVCEVCKTGEDSIPMVKERKNIPRLRAKCPLRKRGCVWKGSLGEIDTHLNECAEFILNCSNVCGVLLKRSELRNHCENECQLRKVKCKYCGATIQYKLLENHNIICLEFPFVCPNECLKSLIRKELESHIEKECPNTLIACPYKEMGCEVISKRSELPKHEKTFESKHCDETKVFYLDKVKKLESIIQEKVKKLESIIQEKEDQIRQLNSKMRNMEKKYQQSKISKSPVLALNIPSIEYDQLTERAKLLDHAKKSGKKRKHNSESITKDAAARCPKRQKLSDDCEDNRTENMRVIGLYNLGNTCYFNSVLQNLLYLRPFRERLSHTMTRTKYKLVPKKHPELETIEFASDNKPEPGKLTRELFNLQETNYQSEATEGTFGKNTIKKITQKTVKPMAVQDQIAKKHRKFSDGSQQDSHEFFRFMIDMVKDEEIKRLKTAFLKHFNIKNDKPQSKICSVDVKNLKKYASEFKNIFVFTGTFIDDTFGGKMISTVKCEGCDSILDVNEDLLDISLPLPAYSQKRNLLISNQPQSEMELNSEEEVKVKSKEMKRLNYMPNEYPKNSLEYYLMRFFSPIFLEEDYVCNNCNPQLVRKQNDTSDASSDENDDSDSIDFDALKFTSAVKQFHIKTVGPVLTIHLKRFSQTGYGLQKLNKPVGFPLVLDMSPFCVSDTSVLKDCNNQILYGLRGIVKHSGGIRTGHYVAYVNIADWNVSYKISSKRAKSSITEENNGDITSIEQPMDIDPAQESDDNRMLTSENCACEPQSQPTSTPDSHLKHVMPTEEWYHINDSHVSKTDHNHVFSSQAYILFYEKLPLVTIDTHALEPI